MLHSYLGMHRFHAENLYQSNNGLQSKPKTLHWILEKMNNAIIRLDALMQINPAQNMTKTMVQIINKNLICETS